MEVPGNVRGAVNSATRAYDETMGSKCLLTTVNSIERKRKRESESEREHVACGQGVPIA